MVPPRMRGLAMLPPIGSSTPAMLVHLPRKGVQCGLHHRGRKLSHPHHILHSCRTRVKASDDELPAKPPSIIININVEKGDTLESLAETYHIPYEKLLATNQGDSRVRVGQKLRFSMPLPQNREELRSLLTPTKEMVTEVVKDRIRSERAKGKQEITLAEPIQAPPQPNTAVQTVKYLGSIGLKLALLGGVMFAFLTLSKRSKEAADRRATELFTERELGRPGSGPGPVPRNDGSRPERVDSDRRRSWRANRGGEASTSCAAPTTEALNDSQAAASSGAADTAEESALTPHAEEPAWLQLPAVHYALMQGNQQPCFRLATGQHDTRHWLAWEDPEDLRQMLKCMVANGYPTDEMGVNVAPMEPYEYLQTAELNQRSVGFISAGTKFAEDWHDERLMEALTQACQVIPRHPANSPSSAPGILERWRKRTGVAVNNAAGQQNTAWEVRKSADEGDGGNKASEGRFIETTATPMASLEEASEDVHSVPQQDRATDVASSSAGSQSDAEKQSVWQQLKEIGSQNRKGTPAKGGEPRDVAGGQLNAGRIMERSRSEHSGQDLSQHLFGSTTDSPTRDAQNKRNQEYESEQEGERGKETSKHQSQRDREQRYVELLSQQEQEEARARISQVHNEASPADALFEQRPASSNGSSSDSSIGNGAARDVDEQGSSPNPQPAGSGGVTAGDWYGQARQGHRLRDFLASQAARLQEETRQGRPKDWWRQLKVIYVPARDYADGGFGFMITEQFGGQSDQGGQPRRAIIAFESRSDAQEVQWLWESFPENAPGSNKTMPLQPDQLMEIAEHEAFGVVVFRRKQLPVRPGLSERELGAMLEAYSIGL